MNTYKSSANRFYTLTFFQPFAKLNFVMEIKETKQIAVLYYSERTTLTGAMKLVRTVARELYREASNLDLEVTGPIYWIYYGFDGNQETEFTLEIALPITHTQINSGKYEVKYLDNFKSISLTHYGSWANMSEAYRALMQEIGMKSYQLTGQLRELYINMDFENPENNITEIQIGIA